MFTVHILVVIFYIKNENYIFVFVVVRVVVGGLYSGVGLEGFVIC